MKKIVLGSFIALAAVAGLSVGAPQKSASEAADAKVQQFLEKMRHQWRDMNVPEADGRILHDLIVKNKFKRALEIGTSTGHSGIWMAWALSKTGGKLITLEIDERRYREALANFKEAGVSDQIDAHLTDAHQAVQELSGPFDFVFIDADKDWYTNYAKAVIPKLSAGGCIVGHNVAPPRPGGSRGGPRGTAEYFDYMRSLPEFESYLHPDGQNGVAISCKKK